MCEIGTNPFPCGHHVSPRTRALLTSSIIGRCISSSSRAMFWVTLGRQSQCNKYWSVCHMASPKYRLFYCVGGLLAATSCPSIHAFKHHICQPAWPGLGSALTAPPPLGHFSHGLCSPVDASALQGPEGALPGHGFAVRVWGPLPLSLHAPLWRQVIACTIRIIF